MADNKIIASIPRSATEEIHIAISEYKGKKYLDMRVFYTTDDGINWNPTKKGVTFTPDKLDEVKNAIDEAKQLLEAEEE
jgi:hypothetical protein